MVKEFAPRVSKKNRQVIDVLSGSSSELFSKSDRKLLEGARLAEVKLSDILVKDQVRTKFNDASLRELAENIRINGLIQPLVLHREGNKFILLCGERRFRAMNLISMVEAPCFILEGKTQEELMAIQFSENSSREELHYIDKADGILNYKKATGASERKIQDALGISKSEVHRGLALAQLHSNIKAAAKTFNIEKYVLLEFDLIEDQELKQNIQKEILEGKVTKRSELKKAILSKKASSQKSKIDNLTKPNKLKNPLPKKETSLKGKTSRQREEAVEDQSSLEFYQAFNLLLEKLENERGSGNSKPGKKVKKNTTKPKTINNKKVSELKNRKGKNIKIPFDSELQSFT